MSYWLSSKLFDLDMSNVGTYISNKFSNYQPSPELRMQLNYYYPSHDLMSDDVLGEPLQRMVSAIVSQKVHMACEKYLNVKVDVGDL